MRVIILGGDGFCGWPTALHLSARGWDVLIVDNLSRRNIDNELEVQSLTPIRTMGERIAAWKEVSGKTIEFENITVGKEFDRLVALIRDWQPDSVVHFAEQRAAPYSMKSARHKLYTVDNNLNATNHLLAAIVESGLDVHLAHLGTMGVYGYGTAAEATARIPALHPDVAVLDARLPDGSGIEVCRGVRAVDPSIRALILTSYDDDEALFAAIMAGAAGYVLKDVKGLDLVAAIKQVADGNSLIDPALTARVLERVRNGPATAPELAELTEQELKLLALIAEGLTNRQIGERMFLAEKTVKNYVSSILAKLGLERRTQAAVLASKLLGPDGRPR